ncbi:hypothetical protein HK102_013096, partial [Quaeritorhiza haematococci]
MVEAGAGSVSEGQPDRRPAAFLVFDRVFNDFKAVGGEPYTVFLRVEAGVVERFAFERADRRPEPWPGREQQRPPRPGRGREDLEHGPLIIPGEVEEAVPCEDAIETTAHVQPPHVPDDPLVFGEPRPAKVDQRRRGVHARDPASPPDQVSGDRLTPAAAEIEHVRAREPVEEP